MNRRLFILVTVVVYFILCGKSCDDDTEMSARQIKEVAEVKGSIREEFETEYLSEESRYAAEISAIQKLRDFSDYFKICTDVSMDPLFREKAADMVRGLFIDDAVILSFTKSDKKTAPFLTSGQFLATGLGREVYAAEIIFDSIRVSESLARNNDHSYKGKIACNQTLSLNIHPDSVLQAHESITVEITATRSMKVFGPDTIRLWQVFLGDMEVK
jgi:hypothetical protein